jgi:hypothetical protein
LTLKSLPSVIMLQKSYLTEYRKYFSREYWNLIQEFLNCKTRRNLKRTSHPASITDATNSKSQGCLAGNISRSVELLGDYDKLENIQSTHKRKLWLGFSFNIKEWHWQNPFDRLFDCLNQLLNLRVSSSSTSRYMSSDSIHSVWNFSCINLARNV